VYSSEMLLKVGCSVNEFGVQYYKSDVLFIQ
jgi:hypothetical protein